MGLYIAIQLSHQISDLMLFELDGDNTWRLKPPYYRGWRNYTPWPHGRWDRSFGDEVHLRTEEGTEMFLLRCFEKTSGPAFWGLANGRYSGEGQWRRAAKPLPHGGSGVWGGLAAKVGGEIVIGGDAAGAAVVSVDNPQRWFSLSVVSGRIGAAAGGAGGLSLVVLTGVQRPNDINGYIQGGWDFALSLGPKWGALAKNLPHVKEYGQLLELVLKNGEQLANAAKGVVQENCLDWEDKGFLVVDTPAGGGTEAGIYYAIGRCGVISTGNAQ